MEWGVPEGPGGAPGWEHRPAGARRPVWPCGAVKGQPLGKALREGEGRWGQGPWALS